MARPDKPQASRPNWVWLVMIVLLGVLLVVVLVSPSGDRDGDVDDPVAIEEMGEEQTPPPGEGTAPAPEPFAPGGDPEGT